MDAGDEVLLQKHTVLRCANAAMLLLSLKQSPDFYRLGTESCDHEAQEKELTKKKIDDLVVALARERIRRREVKVCSVLALILQISLLLAVWCFLLVLVHSLH